MPKRCILDSETEEDSHVGFELLYRGFFQQDFRSLLSDLVRIWWYVRIQCVVWCIMCKRHRQTGKTLNTVETLTNKEHTKSFYMSRTVQHFSKMKQMRALKTPSWPTATECRIQHFSPDSATYLLSGRVFVVGPAANSRGTNIMFLRCWLAQYLPGQRWWWEGWPFTANGPGHDPWVPWQWVSNPFCTWWRLC